MNETKPRGHRPPARLNCDRLAGKLQRVRDRVAVTAIPLLLALALGASSPAGAAIPNGWLDGIDGAGNAGGWALDPDVPAQSIDVHFYVDGPAGTGVFAGAATADLPRPDVTQVTGHPGDHGFSWRIPDQFRDGIVHQLYVHGIDVSGDVNELLSGVPGSFALDAADAIAPPQLDSVSPNVVTQHQQVTVTVNGLGFRQGAVVVLSDGPDSGDVPMEYVSDIELRWSGAPAIRPGNYTLRVKNPDGQLSSGLPFQVQNRWDTCSPELFYTDAEIEEIHQRCLEAGAANCTYPTEEHKRSMRLIMSRLCEFGRRRKGGGPPVFAEAIGTLNGKKGNGP